MGAGPSIIIFKEEEDKKILSVSECCEKVVAHSKCQKDFFTVDLMTKTCGCKLKGKLLVHPDNGVSFRVVRGDTVRVAHRPSYYHIEEHSKNISKEENAQRVRFNLAPSGEDRPKNPPAGPQKSSLSYGNAD